MADTSTHVKTRQRPKPTQNGVFIGLVVEKPQLAPADPSLSELVDTTLFKVQDLALCTFVDALIAGLSSKTQPEVPDVGEWYDLAQSLRSKAARCKGSAKTFTSLFSSLRSSEPAFDDLYSRWEQARKNGKPSSPSLPAPAPATDSVPTMPALDPKYLPKPGLSAGVGKWISDFEELCKTWAGRSYKGHYEVAAVWLLATVAASRVGIVDGDLTWTPIYAAIIAESSVWGKTTLVKIPTKILKQAGLSWLFGSNLTTPEKLLSNMAGTVVPTNYAQMTLDQQEIERLRLAHSGQVGWSYPEFGQLLTEMSNDKGRNSSFKHILRVMDDCEEEYAYDTHSRGKETIERPCLALVGTMTPTCMQPYSGTGADSWGNGLYGRLMIACHPAGVRKTREQLEAETRPEGEMVIPDSLVKPLVEWNKRLNVRDCEIEILIDKNDNVTGYNMTKGVFPVTKYAFAPGVKKMLEDYSIELMLVSQEPELKQLESCYARLRDKAMRVAALVASIEDVKGTHLIEARHMAYGIEFAEHRRQDLHNLIANLNVSASDLADKALEAAIFSELRRRGKPATARQMRQIRKEIEQAAKDGHLDAKLRELVEAGELVKVGNGRKVEYSLPEV